MRTQIDRHIPSCWHASLAALPGWWFAADPQNCREPMRYRDPWPMLIRVRRRGRRFVAFTYCSPRRDGIFKWGPGGEVSEAPWAPPEGGLSVLGRYPTVGSAVEAARAVLLMHDEVRLCSLRDIDQARKLRAKLAAEARPVLF